MKDFRQPQAAFNTSDGAKYISVSRRTLQRLLDNKEIHFRQVGKRRVIPKASLDAWLMGEGEAK